MILHAGSGEPVKGTVHAALGALAIVCLTYNVCAFCCRKSPHLAVNVGVYAALVWWETRAVRSHRMKSTTT